MQFLPVPLTLCKNKLFKLKFSGVEKIDENSFISFLKANNILLHEDLENIALKEIKRKINVNNVATHYQVSKLFNFRELTKLALSYIERCFPSVCKSLNCLELDFTFFAKILANSELHIDSELEILDAAENWVSYRYDKRSKFAKDLLLKVRLTLLPFHNLNSLSNRYLYFNKIEECVEILRDVSQNDKNVYLKKPKTFFRRRFCTQNMFNIIVSGGEHFSETGKGTVLDNFQQVDGKNFNVVKSLASMTLGLKFHKVVYCKGEMYVFGGYDNNLTFRVPVEKYSLINNTWEHVADMSDNRIRFCARAFTDKIFIIGGHNKNFDFLNSCLKFETKDKKWEKVAKLNDARSKAACTVFEGRVIVAGGFNNEQILNTVEAYDHVYDTWSYMPKMIEKRVGNSSVAVRNKLFIIGIVDRNRSETCEVFDSTCKKFVFLKQRPNSVTFRLNDFVQTYSIGSKLITFCHGSATSICYDVQNDEWSEKPFEVTENRFNFCCTSIPKMKF